MCIDGWVVDKENVYMYNGILFNLKKVVLPFVTASMSLKGIMLNEINQTEKDSYITPMWILKKKKKLST